MWQFEPKRLQQKRPTASVYSLSTVVAEVGWFCVLPPALQPFERIAGHAPQRRQSSVCVTRQDVLQVHVYFCSTACENFILAKDVKKLSDRFGWVYWLTSRSVALGPQVHFTNPSLVDFVGYIGWIVGLLFLVPFLLACQVRRRAHPGGGPFLCRGRAEKTKQHGRVEPASCETFVVAAPV